MATYEGLGLKGCRNMQARDASWEDLLAVEGFPFSEPTEFDEAVSVYKSVLLCLLVFQSLKFRNQ